MINLEFFKCYSIDLHRFLKANGKRYMSKGFNETTNKNFWVYEKDFVVCELLTIWSKQYQEQE